MELFRGQTLIEFCKRYKTDEDCKEESSLKRFCAKLGIKFQVSNY